MSQRPCDLCNLVRYTQWHAEFYHPFSFVILGCDSCDVPMVVLREHLHYHFHARPLLW